MPQTNTSQITIRRASDRFHSNHGWLDSRHTFSFANHFDPAHVNYRSLRVINDDTVMPGRGFGTHPHQSMEIFTYVISGALEHRDSMGNGRTITAGQLQYMSAGDGVEHSEFNPSSEHKSHFLQIWIAPSTSGGEPRYQDFDTMPLRLTNGLTRLVSPDGHPGTMPIRQNAEIHFGLLEAGRELDLTRNESFPHNWLHLIKGSLKLDDATLQPGDGASFESSVTASATEDAEFLLFRLS